MQSFVGTGIGKILVIRASRGEKLLPLIEGMVQEAGIKNGVIMSGVATLQKVHYHCVQDTSVIAKEEYDAREGAYEVGSVQGLILNYIPHVHFTAKDHSDIVIAHLERDSEILYVGEIVIGEILGEIHLERKRLETGESYYAEIGGKEDDEKRNH